MLTFYTFTAFSLLWTEPVEFSVILYFTYLTMKRALLLVRFDVLLGHCSTFSYYAARKQICPAPDYELFTKAAFTLFRQIFRRLIIWRDTPQRDRKAFYFFTWTLVTKNETISCLISYDCKRTWFLTRYLLLVLLSFSRVRPSAPL